MSNRSELQRLVRLKRKAAGLCIGCGKAPPVAQRSQCAKCLANLSRRARELTAERRSRGLCLQCGRPRAAGILHCRRCRPLSEETLARRKAAQERRQTAEQRKRQARELVREHLHLLTTRQREVMELRVGLKDEVARSRAELAAILSVSRQAVWQVEAAAWKRIEEAQRDSRT